MFFATLRGVDWGWLGVAICLIFLSYLGRALRWQAMIAPLWKAGQGHPIGILRLTSDTIIGATAGVLLGRVSEVVRPYLISVQTGLSLSSQAAAWFLERILDLLALLLLWGGALTAISQADRGGGMEIHDALLIGGYSLALSAVLCLVLLFAFRDPQGRAKRRFLSALDFLPPHQRERAAGVMEAFARGLACTRDAQSLGIIIAYTVLEWAIIIVGAFTMFRAFGPTHGFGWLQVLVLLAFVSVGSVAQVPGVGGGVQAACIVALTKIYGVSLEAATGVGFLFWFFGSYSIVPVGVAGAFHEGLNWGKLKLLSTKQIME